MGTQNYANHRRYVVGYHYVLTGVLLAALAGAVWNVFRALGRGSGRLEAAVVLLLAFGAALAIWYVRSFPLAAQDRAIRAEENLRHFALTGKLLDPRLTIRQIVALRFASDDEFVALAKRAVEERLSQDAVKRAITSWRPDEHRV